MCKNAIKSKIHIKNKQISEKIILKYKSLAFNNNFSLLEIKLITVKSRQILAQLKNINLPIIDDKRYGDNKINIFFKNKFNLEPV